MSTLNKIANVGNRFQGDFKRVLCVCSAGLLRSPTAAYVLSLPPYNFNTRAAGIASEYAVIEVDTVLLSWADEIVCMQHEHADAVNGMLAHVLGGKDKPVHVLGVPDSYPYRDEKLMQIIRDRYDALTAPQNPV